MKTIKSMTLLLGILVVSLGQCFGQTNLQFTAVGATDEGNIQLTWSSISNEVYEVDEADALVDTNTDSTTWNLLYKNYPSQGTNTFWLDTGNYNLTPQILNPKDMPMRFYRIVDLGPDTTSDEPSVSIISPTNGTSVFGELTITVVASTDQPVLSGTLLYVDGQEMRMADSTTNYTDSSGVTNYEMDTYTVNTCEWPNGSHILFATTKCASGYGDALNGTAILFGHAVSAFVPVTFDNLITRISFSQPFFDPAAGQSQQVSAVFTANSDWTLNIADVNSNIVFTATGSGTFMQFNWDGNGTGDTNLAPGIYFYYISAETNGESSDVVLGGSEGGSGESPLSPDFAASAFAGSEPYSLWAVPAGSAVDAMPVPLALYPPGFDTNSLTIFEASDADIASLRPSLSPIRAMGFRAMDASADDDSGGGGGPAGQNAPAAPSRPPPTPTVGTVGLFTVAYQDYLPEMISIAAPLNGIAPGAKVYIQGTTQNQNLPSLETADDDNFIETMKRGAWQPFLVKACNQLQPSDLRKASIGGADIFNNGGSFGYLHLHGGYGTSQDDASGANFAEQIYFAVGNTWVRMSEMSLGSPGVNGLKWMVLHSCDSLRQQNWNSMRSAGWLPFNGNLHLLLGANSLMYGGNSRIFAKFMLGLDNNPKETIMDAWRDSAQYCFHGPVTLAVAGYSDCEQDMLTGTNSYTPSGSVFYQAFSPQ